MEQTIKNIVNKAQQEGCIKGNYVLHIENPELFSYNVKLDDGMIITIPYELAQEFGRNSLMKVCTRIIIKK